MEFTELSLAPAAFEHEINLPMKRKADFVIQNSVDLQLKEPLPLDWEQCLDLESGRMYYLNRKTLRRTWHWPEDQKLDLDLNISSYSDQQRNGSEHHLEDLKKQKSSSSKSSMIALACSNCHLLVILSQSSPSCPNCKYVHPLPSPNNPTTAKFLNNLSL